MSQTNHSSLRSRANLRAQRQVRSQLQQTNLATRQPIPELVMLPERNPDSPKIVKCFQTFQWKYDIDAHSPLWKRLFHKHIYLRFVRWCWDYLGLVLPEAIIPPNANLPNGALLVKEWQGAFSERWMAEQEASRHLHGGYTEVNFNWSEIAATTEPRSICPASPGGQRLRDKRNWDELAALERLQETLVRTRPQMEAFKSLRT